MHFLLTLMIGLTSFNLLAQTCEETSILSPELAKNIEHINQTVYSDLYSCLEKISADPLLTTGYQNSFWQNIDGKKTFVARCSEDMKEKDEVRFVMIGKDGIQTLNYPTFSYQVKFKDGSTDTAKLPRNFMRFYIGDDEYIFSEEMGAIVLVPRSKLAAAAKEAMTSVARIESEYIKKYETFLTEKNGLKHVSPVNLSPEKMPTLECLERIIPSLVRLIIEKEGRRLIPYSRDLNIDLPKIYNSTKQELLANQDLLDRYKLTGKEVRESLTQFFLGRLGNNCKTQIDAQIMDKLIDKFYKRDLDAYTNAQRVFSERIK